MNTDQAMDNKVPLPSFADAALFHGHVCPGLSIGYRVALRAMEEMGSARPSDEEIVAVVENDSCAVDAVQVITGCTVGKGNLLLRDFGKQVYTFFIRSTGEGIRLAVKADFDRSSFGPRSLGLMEAMNRIPAPQRNSEEYLAMMAELSEVVMEVSDDLLFSVRKSNEKPPERARIFESLVCSECKERVSESRARVVSGNFVCIPCAGEYKRGW